jgi:hypothetical protein
MNEDTQFIKKKKNILVYNFQLRFLEISFKMNYKSLIIYLLWKPNINFLNYELKNFNTVTKTQPAEYNLIPLN